MSYRSLYRKWRPLKFDQLVGQEHITRTLKNALSRGSVSHAYLFCGPRGTGKTTVAKIFARAVNCTDFVSGEPCGECKSCISIINGASMDVLELDAASNRGIDEMRDLKEKTRYMAGEGLYKVYIIDEVHMLTNEAFNALLKTLEEPPAGIIFILATTDPSKLPPTVISRCQRLDFRLLTVTEVNERLKEVALSEGWDFEEGALLLISRISEGALRDALGLMEQAYAFGGGMIRTEDVYLLTGLTKEETVVRVAESLVNGDISAGLKAVQEVTFGGKDLQLFLKEQMQFYKQLLIFISGASQDETEDRYYEYLIKFKDSFSKEALLEFINILNQARIDIRFSEHAHFILEITFLNMMNAMNSSFLKNEISLKEKIAELEEKIAKLFSGEYKALNGEKSPVDNETSYPGELKSSEKVKKETQDDLKEVSVNDPKVTKSADENLQNAKDLWNKTLNFFNANKRQTSILALVQMVKPLEIKGSQLVLSYEKNNQFLKEKLQEVSRLKLIEKVISEISGSPLMIKLVEQGTITEPELIDDKAKKEISGNLPKYPAKDVAENFAAIDPENKEKVSLPVETENEGSSFLQKDNNAENEIKEADFTEKRREHFSSSESGNYIFEEAQKLFKGKIIENDN